MNKLFIVFILLLSSAYSQYQASNTWKGIDSSATLGLKGWGGKIITVPYRLANTDFNTKNSRFFYHVESSAPFTPERFQTLVANYVSSGNSIQVACYRYASIDTTDGSLSYSDTLILHNKSDTVPITQEGFVYCTGGVGSPDRLQGPFVLSIVLFGSGNSQLAQYNTGRSDAYINWQINGTTYPDTIISPIGGRSATGTVIPMQLFYNQ